MSFVDDCAIVAHAPANAALVKLIKQIVVNFLQATQARALQINFSAGKTEAICNFRGRYSKAHRRFLAEHANHFQWVVDDQPLELRVVTAYQHLGIWIQADHSHRRDALHRTAMAKQAWGPLARSFFARKQISSATKAQVFETLAISRATYNCHVWSGADAKAWEFWERQLRAPVATLARPGLQRQPPFIFSTEHLASLAGLLPPLDQVHANRLRYMKRFAALCTPAMWSWLKAADTDDTSWLQACRDSLQWLRKFDRHPLGLPDPSDMVGCLMTIQLDDCWKGRIKAASKACRRYRAAQAEYAVWLTRFKSRLQADGAELPAETPPMPEQIWTCVTCDAVFASQKAPAVHAYKVHDYKAKACYFALGDTCNACGICFIARNRLQRHLEHQPRCFATYMACFPPAEEQTVDQLDQIDRGAAVEKKKLGWQAHKALLPALPVFGPLLPPAGSHDAAAFYRHSQLL